MIERKITRRKGGPLDAPINDRRRPAYERRGTVPATSQPTPEQELFGERRRHPNER